MKYIIHENSIHGECLILMQQNPKKCAMHLCSLKLKFMHQINFLKFLNATIFIYKILRIFIRLLLILLILLKINIIIDTT